MAYRIMLADDEPIMRKALINLTDWETLDCEIVYVAENGQDVYENLDACEPDILVTDIRMPGMTGIEIAKYIWEEKKDIQIIFLTGYADFSFAQSALKLGVLDYVIKDGNLNSLVEAVEKAKDVCNRLKKNTQTDLKKHVENFFKSVFNGSLYEEDEVLDAAEMVGLSELTTEYAVLLLRFMIRDEDKIRGGKTTYESLENFFEMTFGENLLGAVPVERDTFAIVVSLNKNGREKMLSEQCRQIIDTMDNYMHMDAYLSIGAEHGEILELSDAFREAKETLESNFIENGSKILRYENHQQDADVFPTEISRRLELLDVEIENGNAPGSQQILEELFTLERKYENSAMLVKNIGIAIQNNCRILLDKVGKSIYETTGIEGSISKIIYDCDNWEDYKEILNRVVNSTAKTIHIGMNTKNSLIEDCNKYIERNFDKNILVTDIAKKLGVSISYLSRVYKEKTGQTIIYTLNQMKLEQAKKYLRHSDMKIYEIADKLGFENTTYFSKFFKKYSGYSPKDYQLENQNVKEEE
ncbi:MAG: response regulator [Lachnospiraceae bacterium]|nr:response regulator [Lachnospiraceae bacterium]